VTAICNLIGRSFLSTIYELELAGLTAADGPIKGIGLIISLYLHWFCDLERYGIRETRDLE
jgi:hypothetical protein